MADFQDKNAPNLISIGALLH